MKRAESFFTLNYLRSAFLFFFLFALGSAHAQNIRDFRKEALLLKETLLEHHYHPAKIDDRFSQLVFGLMLNKIDPYHLYLTNEEIQKLKKYEKNIDDELNGKGWFFFNDLRLTYQLALTRATASITQLTKTPFVWKSNEYFVQDTSRWEKDENELLTKHQRWLKYETLQRLSLMAEPASLSEDFVKRNEAEARQRVRQSNLRKIDRMLKHPGGFENYFATQYFQVITSIFDPHTSYLSATDMENFMSMLSTEGYYFGFTLEENEKGEVAIATLSPGGPAWQSGELNPSDVLIHVKWENQQSFDMSGMTVEEVGELLEDANHATAEFTVRKADGIEKTIRIQKAKITSEESYVRGFMLQGKKRIGYISLPDFYTRWGNNSEGSRCANDVAKEILKLKKEKLDGLILDIRYNGGGSLHEAVALAGIFIDEGTLGFLKDKNQKVTPLKDINRGTVYDGPLLLMVNGQSASASEFLAAVLQDYHRAVIVGSRTFGKASAQNIFSLDKNISEGSPGIVKNGIGYATITTEKLYRATGKTAQGDGVVPDLALPDVFDLIDYHESRMPFVLPADTLTRKSFLKVLPALPVQQLHDRSRSRLTANETFKKLQAVLLALAEEEPLEAKQKVLLSWQSIDQKQHKENSQAGALKKSLTNATETYSVLNTTLDLQRMTIDQSAKDFNRLWTSKLKNDLYLEEAFQIICDYIDLVKKP